jgi:hypothetical protein
MRMEEQNVSIMLVGFVSNLQLLKKVRVSYGRSGCFAYQPCQTASTQSLVDVVGRSLFAKLFGLGASKKMLTSTPSDALESFLRPFPFAGTKGGPLRDLIRDRKGRG